MFPSAVIISSPISLFKAILLLSDDSDGSQKVTMNNGWIFGSEISLFFSRQERWVSSRVMLCLLCFSRQILYL